MTVVTQNNGEWQGSERTQQVVREQIEQRWGEAAATAYDPRRNCFTLKTWNRKGYRVKKGEKGLRSITYLRKQEIDDETGEVKRRYKYPRPMVLFYITQVEKIKKAA